MEYRAFRAESVGVDDKGTLEGLVTPFGRETVIGDLDHGGFREEIAKGAFTKTLREGDPLMVYQHDLSRPLARKSAGNLDLTEGEFEGQAGVVMRASPVDTSYARDLRALVEARVITGMSFGFQVIKDEWLDDKGQQSDRFAGTRRVLREVKLIEVSPVTRPAYTNTAIMARDEASALIEDRAAVPAEPAAEPEPRDDPDGKEYDAMRRAVTALEKDPPDVTGAISVLRERLPRSDGQEPETSTPDDDERRMDALRAARFRELQSRIQAA